MAKGWVREPRRHSLASKGIKTANNKPTERAMQKEKLFQQIDEDDKNYVDSNPLNLNEECLKVGAVVKKVYKNGSIRLQRRSASAIKFRSDGIKQPNKEYEQSIKEVERWEKKAHRKWYWDKDNGYSLLQQ